MITAVHTFARGKAGEIQVCPMITLLSYEFIGVPSSLKDDNIFVSVKKKTLNGCRSKYEKGRSRTTSPPSLFLCYTKNTHHTNCRPIAQFRVRVRVLAFLSACVRLLYLSLPSTVPLPLSATVPSRPSLLVPLLLSCYSIFFILPWQRCKCSPRNSPPSP